ncbi:MAG: hypothetical protein IKU66_06585 [Clostridia bacterium]|nr:hypothetical protein [Clostridia bacterium]
MKKYFYIRYQIYYAITMFLYVSYPWLILINEIVSIDNDDIHMFNQLLIFSIGIFLCLQYIFAIIPTVTFFKMNKGHSYKRYWYSSVFDLEKVYGTTRKLLVINIVVFCIIECIICFIRILRNLNIFVSSFWMPIASFVLLFSVSSLMSGLFLELKGAHKK